MDGGTLLKCYIFWNVANTVFVNLPYTAEGAKTLSTPTHDPEVESFIKVTFFSTVFWCAIESY